MYPEITPHFTALLPVSSTHSVYVERSGKPGGMPVFFLHGGPGSRVNAHHRRYFDPDFYDIILFDQRGCGQSRPLGEIAGNDTRALVEDINTLRAELGITGKICLFGGSWGSTLALAYALRHPQQVEAMILRGIFLGTREELDWYTHGVARFALQAWEEFAPPTGEDPVDYYSRLVLDSDPGTALKAAQAWVRYEVRLMQIGDGHSHQSVEVPLPSPEELLARARVQLHFLRHHCFLEEAPILAAAPELDLPVTIVQGELDLVCPPITAYRLSKRLPDARLRLVNAGHGGLSEPLASVLTEEADCLRDRLKERDESSI